MRDLRQWMLDKIVAGLVARQGCSTVDNANTDLDKAVIRDSMGFIYEVSVSCVGRYKNNVEDDVQWRTQLSRKA